MAFVGPVRQVDTLPTIAVINEPNPQMAVIRFIGGVCPAVVKTDIPWLFWAASTVTIKGITSSIIADHEKDGS